MKQPTKKPMDIMPKHSSRKQSANTDLLPAYKIASLIGVSDGKMALKRLDAKGIKPVVVLPGARGARFYSRSEVEAAFPPQGPKHASADKVVKGDAPADNTKFNAQMLELANAMHREYQSINQRLSALGTDGTNVTAGLSLMQEKMQWLYDAIDDLRGTQREMLDAMTQPKPKGNAEDKDAGGSGVNVLGTSDFDD